MNNPNDPESPSVTSDMQTDYVVGQDNIKGQFGPIGFDIHNRVFVVSALASAIFIVLTLLFPERAGSTFQSIVSFSTGTLDWYFMILVDFFILFWASLPITRGCRSRSARPFSRFSASVSGAGGGTSSTYWRCFPPSSGWQRPLGLGHSRPMRG